MKTRFDLFNLIPNWLKSFSEFYVKRRKVTIRRLALLLIAAFALIAPVTVPTPVQAAYTEFYCNSTGTNINAGSTTNEAALFSDANGNWDATTGIFVCSAGAKDLSGVSAGMWASVYVDAATVTFFVGRILTVVDATDTITLSLVASSGVPPTTSSTGRSIKIGGAWHGPYGTEGFPWGFMSGCATNSSGNSPRVNLKNDATYAVTATIVETNGTAGTIGVGPVRFEGHILSPGDGGRSIIDGGAVGTSFCIWSNTTSCKNRDMVLLTFQNNGNTATVDGVNCGGSENSFQRCVFNNLRGHGIILTGVNHLYSCEAFGCNQANATGKGGIALQSSGDMAINCISHHNTTANASGFQLDGGINMLNCIAANNGSSGFRLTADVSQTIYGCSTFMNGGSGIDVGGSAGNISDAMVVNIVNCSFVSNASAGIRISTSAAKYLNGHIENCAFGSGTMTNVAGNFLTTQGGASQDGSSLEGVYIAGNILLPLDTTPWVAPLTGDFRNTSSSVKFAGYGLYTQTYTTTTWTGTVGYPDIGSAEATNSASGGGSYPFVQ